MSLASALKTRAVAELPSRRDEDRRWTDLRGLIRVLPEPSARFEGGVGAGLFDRLAADHHVLVNGGDARIDVAAGKKALVALRLISRGAGAHANKVTVNLAPGARLRLLDYLKPDRVHVLSGGRIVASGGPELALELERDGYDKYARAA